jgi:hypothetical protein
MENVKSKMKSKKATNDNYGLGSEDGSIKAIDNMPGGMFPRPKIVWIQVTYAALIADRTAMVTRFSPQDREAAISHLASGSFQRHVQYTIDAKALDGRSRLRVCDGGSTAEL